MPLRFYLQELDGFFKNFQIIVYRKYNQEIKQMILAFLIWRERDRQTRRGRLAKLKILFELIGSPWLYPFQAAMCLHGRNETDTEMTTVSCLTS